MAKTATTDISTEAILLNPGSADANWVWGYLAADSYPGQAVVKSGDTWVLLDTDTGESDKTTLIGIVGYHKRINSTTGALKIITDAYDISEPEDKRAPIILSGFCVAYVLDQGASLQVLRGLGPSATAGSLTLHATAVVTELMATVASLIVDDDTRAIVGIGKCKGMIWGGV